MRKDTGTTKKCSFCCKRSSPCEIRQHVGVVREEMNFLPLSFPFAFLQDILWDPDGSGWGGGAWSRVVRAQRAGSSCAWRDSPASSTAR